MWSDLADQLQKVPPTGEGGFEELVAALLGELLDEQFVVARSGSQPLGDATNISLATSIQAKRYKSETKLDINEALGSLETADQNAASLETFILVATKTLDANLHSRITIAGNRKGIDVFFLDLAEDGLSDLGALAIGFGRPWADSFPTLPPSQHESQIFPILRKFTRLLTSFRKRLREQLGTKRVATAHSWAEMRQRHLARSTGPTLATRIDPDLLVPRPGVYSSLDAWWNGVDRPCLVEGEEGMGKSWVVAGWLSQSRALEKTPVVWLDSSAWCFFSTARQLIHAIAEKMTGLTAPTESVTSRYTEKLLRRWPSPAVLVVLDGANERQAFRALQAILPDLIDDPTIRRALRVIVTTRPLGLNHLPAVHRSCTHPVQVPAFSDTELDAALTRANIDVTLQSELSPSLRDVLRRPRFFQLCLANLHRLRGFAEVTPELVLFLHLEHILKEKSEPLGIQKIDDGFTLIAELVHGAREDDRNRLQIEANSLGVDGARMLAELSDTDLLERMASRTLISPTHVVIVWAAYFLDFVRRDVERLPFDRVVALRTVQEPALDDDRRSQALGVCARLFACDATRTTQDDAITFLAAWLAARNATIGDTELSRAYRARPTAFLEAVEIAFTLDGWSPAERSLSDLLTTSWLQGGQERETLRPFVERWLNLAFDDTEQPADGSYEFDGSPLPAARTPEALRLHLLAVTVFASAPDDVSLHAFLLYAGSGERSRIRLERPGNEDGRPAFFDLKDPLFGPLVRWGFSDTILPRLEAVASDPEVSACERRGAQRLSAALQLIDLPEVLRIPSRGVRNVDSEASSPPLITGLTTGNADLLLGLDEIDVGNTSPSWGTEIAALAADINAPALSEPDVERLATFLERLVRDHNVEWYPGTTSEDTWFHAWAPWLAKSSPKRWAELLSQVLSKALAPDGSQFPLLRSPVLHAWTIGGAVDAVIRAATPALFATVDEDDSIGRAFGVLRVALHLDDVELLWRFLDLLAPHSSAPTLIHLAQIAGVLRARLRRISPDAVAARIDAATTDSERLFWLSVDAFLHDGQSPSEIEKWFEVRRPSWEPSNDAALRAWFCLLRQNPAHAVRLLRSDSAITALVRVNRPAQHELHRWLNADVSSFPADSYDTLQAYLPGSVLGTFLQATGRTEDLPRWARSAFATACSQTAPPPGDLASELRPVEYEVSPSGAFRYVRQTSGRSSRHYYVSLEHGWGLQSGDAAWAAFSSIGGINDTAQKDRRQKIAEFQSWFEALERHDAAMFGAGAALRAWADQDPRAFVDEAERLAVQLSRTPRTHAVLALFLHQVLLAWLQIDPERAIDQLGPLFVSLPVRFRTEEIPSLVYQLWDLSRFPSTAHAALRSRLIAVAPNDLSLAYHAVAARRHRSTTALREISSSLLSSSLSFERCLGVSLLAWLPAADEPLRELKRDSVSRWVQRHSAWALRVRQRESNGLMLYQHALSVETETDQQAALYRLVPILLPTASLWESEDAALSLRRSNLDPSRQALLVDFLGRKRICNSIYRREDRRKGSPRFSRRRRSLGSEPYSGGARWSVGRSAAFARSMMHTDLAQCLLCKGTLLRRSLPRGINDGPIFHILVRRIERLADTLALMPFGGHREDGLPKRTRSSAG